MDKKPLGKITHYFDKVGVGVLELSDTIKIGDKILIEGHGRSFEQTVDSMQIERQPVEEAKAGQSIGLKTAELAKEGDLVFKVVE